MKTVVIALLMLLILPITCHAETREIITEGTYVMGENDTPAQAEQGAILNAKREALEQVGTFVLASSRINMGELKSDQINELSMGVIQSEVLEKSKKYDGQSLVYWVKIKSTVTMDNLAEAITNAIKASTKKVVGVVVNFDLTEPEENDSFWGRKKSFDKHPYQQLEKDHNLIEPIKSMISNQYTNRAISLEYIKDMPSDLQTYAKQNNYNYIIMSNLKFTKLKHRTHYLILAYYEDWSVEAECTVKLYDIEKNTIVFNKVYTAKIVNEFTPSLLPGTSNELIRSLDSSIDQVHKDLIWQIKKELPTL